MSVQSTPETYTCSYCSESYPASEKVKGSYCSERCYYQHKGDSALSQIKDDHRWCATCFRPVKTTWKPNRTLIVEPADHDQDVQYKNVLIGYQHPTEHMVWATTDDAREPADHRPRQCWGCECGNLDLSTRDETLEDVELKQLPARLYWCLQAFAETGALEAEPDREQLFDALREEWRDWPYAVGRALYDTGAGNA